MVAGTILAMPVKIEFEKVMLDKKPTPIYIILDKSARFIKKYLAINFFKFIFPGKDKTVFYWKYH